MVAQTTAPTPPPNDPNDLVPSLGNHNNIFSIYWKTSDREGHYSQYRMNTTSWNNQSAGHYGDVSNFQYASNAAVYKNASGLAGLNWLFKNNAQVGFVEFNYKKVGNTNYVWQNMKKGSGDYGSGNESLTINTLNTKGDLNFEVKLGGTSNITTLNNEAERLNMKVDNENNDRLNITTLNQNTTGISQIFKNVSVDTFNLYAGRSYQRGGTVTNLNIQGGSFYQGYKDNLTPSEHDGTIETITLQDGIFQQGKGSVTTLNQSGGGAKQEGGSITNLNLSGGTFTHNGGTLSNVVLKAGGSGSTFVNGTNSAFANITQEGGNHTIIGKVAKFTLASGSFTNNGSIETLTTNTTTRALRNAQAATTNHITNNGTIDKLELTKDATSVTNNAVYNTGGGLASGIIKELDVKSGNATINTLNGVGQGTAANVEPHTLSNIKITANSAKLTVDTLSVGLKGNQAMERVTINNNTGNSGGKKEFAVNKIQVTYIDGTFDPAKSISKNLKDYVSSNTISQSYVDQSSKPTFESSPELQG
ncbi:hypothetical protein, partial [Helicobacter canis]|uniref:hypothetical protein n=1 Tax=Helicobacter canis TaxID=29419 RepID=UPI002942314E